MLNDYLAIRNLLRSEVQIKLTRCGPDQKIFCKQAIQSCLLKDLFLFSDFNCIDVGF